MDKETKQQKNKEAIGAIITLVGICFIIFGAAFGVSNMMENSIGAFFLCLFGTILTFVGNYFRNGYLKFFN